MWQELNRHLKDIILYFNFFFLVIGLTIFTKWMSVDTPLVMRDTIVEDRGDVIYINTRPTKKANSNCTSIASHIILDSRDSDDVYIIETKKNFNKGGTREYGQKLTKPRDFKDGWYTVHAYVQYRCNPLAIRESFSPTVTVYLKGNMDG